MKVVIFIAVIFVHINIYSQQNSCIDSSYRMQYEFAETQTELFVTPIGSTGTNFFSGYYRTNPNLIYGIPLMKTTWGDSIIYSKKIYVSAKNVFITNSVNAPNKTLICSGIWNNLLGSNTELLITRLSENGDVLWAKRFRTLPIHQYYFNYGSQKLKNITVTNNAIYVNAIFNDEGLNVVAKLDMDGNIIWSKAYSMLLPSTAFITDAVAYHNNTVFFHSSQTERTNVPPFVKSSQVITKINDADGSLIETWKYTTLYDSLSQTVTDFKFNPLTKTFTSTGYFRDANTSALSDNIFINNFDTNLSVVNSNYYTNNIHLDPQKMLFDVNNKNQMGFLTNNINSDKEKYFAIFDDTSTNLIRSRKFNISSTNISSVNRNDFKLDDKQNLHYLFNYTQNGKSVTEYARISNFSPNSTEDCFGKDTNYLTKQAFTLIKKPHVWDNEKTNILWGIDVPFLTDTTFVTKQLICKQVSVCDSIKIKGKAQLCVGEVATYTLYKNPQCFKNVDWFFDTSYVTILNTQSDTAYTITFKKPFTGKFTALVNNCVVSDTFTITVIQPPLIAILNKKDTLLCPGKTITLNAATGFTNYTWQNGTMGSSFTLNDSGWYKITATNSCNNVSSDSVYIYLSDTSLAVPSTQTICAYDTAYIRFPTTITSLLWQPIQNTLYSNNVLSLFPLQNTTYKIIAERQPNCIINKTTNVVVNKCEQTIYIPNAFTPNADRWNNTFKPTISQRLLSYRLIIFNRYGQKLFETTDKNKSWDGTFNGKLQPIGTYVYHCFYLFPGKKEEVINGWMVLLR